MKSLKLRISALAIMMAIGAIGVTFTSCQKDNQIVEPQKSESNNYQAMSHSSGNTISHADARTIGNLHNQYMGEGILNTPITTSDMKSKFNNMNVPEVTQDMKNEIYDYFENNSIDDVEEDILSELQSTESTNIFNSTKSIIFNNKNFQSKSNEFDTQLGLVEAQLFGSEKEMLLTFIETSRSSLSFWMPVEDGGQGGGVDYTPYAVDWKAVGYSDGAGAVGVLLRTWALASFGPLSWGAIVGAIGWGAAWSSGTALLWQLSH
jgi:hypothetical protein